MHSIAWPVLNPTKHTQIEVCFPLLVAVEKFKIIKMKNTNNDNNKQSEKSIVQLLKRWHTYCISSAEDVIQIIVY